MRCRMGIVLAAAAILAAGCSAHALPASHPAYRVSCAQPSGPSACGIWAKVWASGYCVTWGPQAAAMDSDDRSIVCAMAPRP